MSSPPNLHHAGFSQIYITVETRGLLHLVFTIATIAPQCKFEYSNSKFETIGIIFGFRYSPADRSFKRRSVFRISNAKHWRAVYFLLHYSRTVLLHTTACYSLSLTFKGKRGYASAILIRCPDFPPLRLRDLRQRSDTIKHCYYIKFRCKMQ